jgi:AraC-like DNA-binding protein/ligand-binding sensor protein
MSEASLEQILQEACDSPVLCKLDVLARDLIGVGLLVVWFRGGTHGQVPVCLGEGRLPQFCHLLHEVPQGLQQCGTCHMLLALAARGQDHVTQGYCHAGTSVLAVPAICDGSLEDTELVVISSCAMGLGEDRQGRQSVRRVARDLDIDLATLHNAYKKLPRLHGKNIKMLGNVLQAAAAALKESLQVRMASTETKERNAEHGDIVERLCSALTETRQPSCRNAAGSMQRTIVGVVKAVVGANPHLPVSVSDIALAAQISPNHFSLIFHQQTGQTFTEFLADVRFKRAQERLRDLTLSVSQVARQCGFSDPNYFTKVFQRRAGLSPSAWRKKSIE